MCKRHVPDLNEGERAEADMLLATLPQDDPGSHFFDEDVWCTADGVAIPFDELTHGHLAAIIKMIQRELHQAQTGYWPNGEQAGYALEDAIRQRESELEALEAEKARRRAEAFPL